jgi:hypothetical protein
MYACVQIARIPKRTMAAAVDSSSWQSSVRVREVPQVNFAGTTEKSGNLFVEKPIPRRPPVIKRRLAPELAAARVLCHQLRNKRARPDKKRIVHLICLNLLAILKQRSQQASRV